MLTSLCLQQYAGQFAHQGHPLVDQPVDVLADDLRHILQPVHGQPLPLVADQGSGADVVGPVGVVLYRPAEGDPLILQGLVQGGGAAAQIPGRRLHRDVVQFQDLLVAGDIQVSGSRSHGNLSFSPGPAGGLLLVLLPFL